MSLIALPLLYLALVMFANIILFQPMPLGHLITIAELELEKQGLPVCENPNGHRVGTKSAPEHDCRWWRFPHYEQRNQYCGFLNDLLKPSPNCMEIIFEHDTPPEILQVFRKALEQPCRTLSDYPTYPRHDGGRSYQGHKSAYRGLRCHKSDDYRHVTAYVIFVRKFHDDETKRLLSEFGDVTRVDKITRTRIFQFI